jgi:Dienelactone hydrolase family
MRHAFCQNRPTRCELTIVYALPDVMRQVDSGSLGLLVTDQTEHVVLGVFDKRQPFLCVGWCETLIRVPEDDVRLGDDLDTIRPQGCDGRLQVIDSEIDEGAGRTVFEQQAYATCLKEHHGRLIKGAGWRCVEQALVKRPRARKVVDVLGDLKDVHGRVSHGAPTWPDAVASGAAMKTRASEIVLDGRTVVTARPVASQPWPGLVMVHEAWGIDDVLRRLADRLASAGYLVYAPDLWVGI